MQTSQAANVADDSDVEIIDIEDNTAFAPADRNTVPAAPETPAGEKVCLVHAAEQVCCVLSILLIL